MAKEAGFVLVEVDGDGAPQLVTQCPANGAIAIEMISVITEINALIPLRIHFEPVSFLAKRARNIYQISGGVIHEDSNANCDVALPIRTSVLGPKLYSCV
jgi:hypothetical protein